MRIEMDEVLACDERVIAMRATVRGTTPHGQHFEVPLGLVDVVENGLFVSADRYDKREPRGGARLLHRPRWPAGTLKAADAALTAAGATPRTTAEDDEDGQQKAVGSTRQHWREVRRMPSELRRTQCL